RREISRRDNIDLTADEIGDQCGQLIIAVLRPTIINGYVLSLDIASFAQTLEKPSHQKRIIRAGLPAQEETDHRHLLLLGAQGARRSHRSAQQEYQLAPPHSMTSSARARIDGGTSGRGIWRC